MRFLRVEFTGSATALRRHVRRDVLVNLVLGGLSTSIVRRRTAQYLAGHTTIDGAPLVQVPVRKSPWPAIVLVLAFVAARLLAEFGHGPPLPVLVAGGVLLLPYLWATATARTVGALRWRDLPLSFTARWTEVYAASWPLIVLGLAWAVAEPAVEAWAAAPRLDARVAATIVAAALGAFPLLCALAFHLHRLRTTRTRVGPWTVAWPARFPAWLRLWTLTAVATLATAVVPVLALCHALAGAAILQDPRSWSAWAAYAAGLLAVLLLSSPARAWHEAQAFVLAWDGVRVGDRLRVACALDVRAFVRMRARDAVRTACTLGAHRSQAVVNAYRAKLAALRVEEG